MKELIAKVSFVTPTISAIPNERIIVDDETAKNLIAAEYAEEVKKAKRTKREDKSDSE